MQHRMERTSTSPTINRSFSPTQASSFGIPAAGVLAIELLRQRDGSSRPTPSTLRRPEAIQNLSVFASYLQFVVFPHEGNYEICQRARRILGRILNQILSPNPSPFPSRLPADAVVADWLNGSRSCWTMGRISWSGSRVDLSSRIAFAVCIRSIYLYLVYKSHIMNPTVLGTDTS